MKLAVLLGVLVSLVGLVSCGTLLTLLLLYWCAPASLLRFYVWITLKRACLTRRYSMVGKYKVSYLEGGNPQASALILIHGFTSHSERWADFIRLLAQHSTKTHHVIAVDMPCHGQSETPESPEQCGVRYMVEVIHSLSKTLALSDQGPYHVIGMSLGGHVAGVLAATYPSEIATLTLMCSAGIDSKEPTNWDVNRLLPETMAELDQMFQLIMYKPIYLPYQIKQVILEEIMAKKEIYMKMASKMLFKKESRFLLQSVAANIQVPTLVIWGEMDQVISPKCANILRNILPNCADVQIIPKCGHSLGTEAYRSIARIVARFLCEQTKVQYCNRYTALAGDHGSESRGLLT